MLTSLSKTWHTFVHTLRGIDSSRQLAMGVGMGMMIGLLPKDSLFTYLIVIALILSTANLLSGALSAMFFSWIAWLVDPIAHRVGVWVLSWDYLETTWAWLIQQPLIPWTRFDNTVVMGSLLIGSLAYLPLYRLSYHVFEMYGNQIVMKFTSNPLVRRLLGNPTPKLESS